MKYFVIAALIIGAAALWLTSTDGRRFKDKMLASSNSSVPVNSD